VCSNQKEGERRFEKAAGKRGDITSLADEKGNSKEALERGHQFLEPGGGGRAPGETVGAFPEKELPRPKLWERKQGEYLG